MAIIYLQILRPYFGFIFCFGRLERYASFMFDGFFISSSAFRIIIFSV